RANDRLQRELLIAGRLAALAPAVDATAAEAQPRAGIGAVWDRQCHGAGHGRHRHARAEHRLRKAHRKLNVDVVALAAEEWMRRDMHLDQRVAGRPAAKTGPALALEAEDLAFLDAGRDRHVEPLILFHG